MATNIYSMGDDKDKINDVSEPSDEYKEYMDILELPHALMGGTRAMIEKGRVFLPQMKAEEDDDYIKRLDQSILYNGYQRTVQKLAGEVFSKPIVVNSDVPADIKEILEEDVDLDSNDLNQFAYNIFTNALVDGVSYVLVDYPQAELSVDENGTILYLETDEEGPDEWRPLTAAVTEAKGWRVRWVLLRAEDVIGFQTEKRYGRTTLKQVRILEQDLEDAGKYGNQEVTRIRVLEPGRYEVWRQADDETANAEDDWILEEQGTTSLDFIPLAICMLGEKRTPLTAEPPLEGCAYLNKAHWQSYSDQRNMLKWIRIVMWLAKMLGVDDGGRIKWAPNSLIHSTSPDADIKSVEHNGHAVAAGREDLKDLEQMMAMFGLTFIMPKTGNTTATEKAIDASENDSVLKGWATKFEDFLNTCLMYTAQMVGAEDGGTVTVNTEFRTVLVDQAPMILLEAFKLSLLPRDIVVEELKKRGILSDDVDPIEVSALLEKDMSAGTFVQAPLPAQPEPEPEPEQEETE